MLLGYAQQLTDCRESLEQLEGYQNQELAKVKHMLLSAETALELEKQERLKLRDQLEELQNDRKTEDKHLLEDSNRHQKDATTNTLDTCDTTTNDKGESKVMNIESIVKKAISFLLKLIYRNPLMVLNSYIFVG